MPAATRILQIFRFVAVSICAIAGLQVKPLALARDATVIASASKMAAGEKIGNFSVGYVSDEVTGEKTKYYFTWMGAIGSSPNIQLIFSCQDGDIAAGINFSRIMYGTYEMRWKGGWSLLRRGVSGRYYLIGSYGDRWPDVGFFDLLSRASEAKRPVIVGVRPEYGGDELTLEFRAEGIDAVVQDIRKDCSSNH